MLEELSLQHGELIFREGEESDYAYLIVSGNVEIFKRSERGTILLASLGEGELFGEMGLLSHEPRSASAAAEGPVVIQRIDAVSLERMLGECPKEITQMMRALMERLREGNQKISRLVAKSAQFQLMNLEPPTIKRVTLLPLSAVTKAAIGQGMVIQLPFRVGRSTGEESEKTLDWNNLTLPAAEEAMLSPNHFAIQKHPEGMSVVDRGSRFGMVVNDVSIGSMHEDYEALLQPGDNIVVAGDASSDFRFCVNWEAG